MRQLATGEPVWDLQFDENGALTAPARGDFLAEVAAQGVTDVFAFSHGWGASQDDALAAMSAAADAEDDPFEAILAAGTHENPHATPAARVMGHPLETAPTEGPAEEKVDPAG